jgi:calpain-15
LCFLCRADCFKYKDKAFPADDTSLGEYEGKQGKGAAKSVIWQRGVELSTKPVKQMALFEGGVEPSDIVQGALGDCWLLSAVTILSMKRGAVEACFEEREYNPRGKYNIRLYDDMTDRFTTVTVDDRIPCNEADGRPLFTSPNGDELWVLLLEKAFAKFVGSYANLELGHSLWALRVMTGDAVLKYDRDLGLEKWSCFELKSKPTPENKRAGGVA